MSISGTVKFFNDMKGFGFIEGGENGDVFVHVNDCGGAQPVEGDQRGFLTDMTFDEEYDEQKGKSRAVNVQGCSGVKSEGGKGFGGDKGKGKKGKGKGKKGKGKGKDDGEWRERDREERDW